MSSLRTVRRNLPYFRGELSALVNTTSLSVKCICITVLCSYLLSYYEPAVNALSVTPGHLLPPSLWVWTLFTNPFLEIHLWEVIVDVVTVGLCGKLIEPLWGTKEMLCFFGIVNFSVAILSVSYYLFVYALTFDPSLLFDVQIHGLSGYIAAVSVAVRQVMPDHVLLRTPLGKLTNRNIPLTVLIVSIITWAIGLLEGSYCTMFASGILTSWIYLRFYQKHSNGTRGDSAENFTFASFFPNVLQPPISVMANSLFKFLVKVGICRKQVKRFVDSSGPSSISISLPGSDTHDAERRRQKALKLLSERLGHSKDEAQRPLLRSESPDEDNASLSGVSGSTLSSASIHRSHSASASLHSTNAASESTGSPRNLGGQPKSGDVVIPV